MTIRSTIILFAVPLFLVLAIINGALLYFQERSEMEHALNDQALATAVTAAEFISEMDNPREMLAQPVRMKAMAAAVRRIEGLGGLYLVSEGKDPLALFPAESGWNLATLVAPVTATGLGLADGGPGDRWISALAPAGNGRFIAARINAEPIFARMDAIKQDILLIVVGAGLFAAALGWFVAHRITRELKINKQSLQSAGSAQKAAGQAADLSIRESHNLAEAVKLMEASREAAESRTKIVMARRDAVRDVQGALAETRAALFAPVVISAGGVELAMRICGDAPMGSFFACSLSESGGALVMGRCNAETPVEALAEAADVRRLLELHLPTEGLQASLDLARAAHDLDVVETLEWAQGTLAGTVSKLISIADAPIADVVDAYGRGNGAIQPGVLLAGLEIMLAPTGIFAAIGPNGSGDGRESGSDIGLNVKDRAESADVENLAN